ncbi:hypothetical protein FHT67_003552 [Paenibacillus sp. BK720]|nr:hypothetical protein [Paenibacillus sp. BK720]
MGCTLGYSPFLCVVRLAVGRRCVSEYSFNRCAFRVPSLRGFKVGTRKPRRALTLFKNIHFLRAFPARHATKKRAEPKAKSPWVSPFCCRLPFLANSPGTANKERTAGSSAVLQNGPPTGASDFGAEEVNVREKRSVRLAFPVPTHTTSSGNRKSTAIGRTFTSVATPPREPYSK